MIKVAYYCGLWNRRGTPLSLARLLPKMNRDKFEPYVLYNQARDNTLLPELRELEIQCMPYSRDMCDENAQFSDIMQEIKPDILHVARNGAKEWPLTHRHAPLQIETNIFGNTDTSEYLDKSICANEYVKMRRGYCDAVLPHPIPDIRGDRYKIRHAKGIADDTLVCGRIGRAGWFHPWAFDAFNRLHKIYPSIRWLLACPCVEAEEYIRTNNIQGIVYADEALNENDLYDFYAACDIFIHYCGGGETFGNCIAEAMMCGLPVISHISNNDDGHIETMQGAGYIAEDFFGYCDALAALIESKQKREEQGAESMRIAKQKYDQEMITRKTEALYEEWLGAI